MSKRQRKKMVAFRVDRDLLDEWQQAAKDNFQTFTDFATLAIGDAIGEYRERATVDRRHHNVPVKHNRRCGCERRAV